MVDPLDRDGSPLDKLTDKLYGRGTDGIAPRGRSRLSRRAYEIPEDWQHENVPPPPSSEKKNNTAVKRLLIFSILFFVVAVGVAAFVIIGGRNIVSTENVAIAVTGPGSIPGGEVLTLQIDVANKNPTTLEVVDLLVEYPAGTRNPEDLAKELPRTRKNLGDLKPGETTTAIVEAVLFGEERSKQSIAISVEYRVAGSNAIFHKERAYEVEISTAPLSLVIAAPARVNSGQEVSFTIDLTSNATGIIENVLLTAEYPFGFTFRKATPEPTFDQHIWDLGDIEQGGRRTIRVEGIVTGQDEEERVFRFESGIVSEVDEKVIETPFITALKSVAIERPFVALDVRLNGEAADASITARETDVRMNITWRNNLPVRVTDGIVEVVLGGAALDKTSVTAQNGFYRSSDSTVVWDKRTVPALAQVESGATGEVAVSFSSLDAPTLASILTNPEIPITVRFRGTTASEDPQMKSVSAELSRTITVATTLSLSARTVHSAGTIANTGPIPPKVDAETTYTIIWSVTNATSDVSRARVRAILPSYVRFTGVVSPSGIPVTYNSATGEVVWEVGDVPPGVGYTSSAREASFQVGITPSLSQVNTAPNLLGEARLEGTDRFSRTTVGDREGTLSTRMPTDPSYTPGDEKVIP